MKSSNIISKGNGGIYKEIIHKEINLLGEWKVDIIYIMRNLKICSRSL